MMAEENIAGVPEFAEETQEQKLSPESENLLNGQKQESDPGSKCETDLRKTAGSDTDGKFQDGTVPSLEDKSLNENTDSEVKKDIHESVVTSEGVLAETGTQISGSENGLPVELSQEGISIKEGLVSLLLPAVNEVDERVTAAKESQRQLSELIESVSRDLQVILTSEKGMGDLETHINKLNVSRRRLLLVNSILQNVQERLLKMGKKVDNEMTKRRNTIK